MASAKFKFSLGDLRNTTPTTLPLRSINGPPLLPGEAAAENLSHCQRPSRSSGVPDVYKPSRITTPSPKALPTANTGVFSGGRDRVDSGTTAGASITLNTAKSSLLEYLMILSTR